MKKVLLSVATMIMVAFGAVAPVMAEETQTLTPVQQTSQANHDAWLQAHGRPTNDQAVSLIAGVLPVGMVLAVVVNVGRTVLLLGGKKGTSTTSAAAKDELLADANGSYNAAAQAVSMMDNAAAQDTANNMMF